MSKQYYPFPLIPDSGKCDQDFSFMSEEQPDALLANVKEVSIEEAVDSIDKLLKKRPQSIRELIKETGHSQSSITKAVAKMVDKGKAAIDSFRTVDNKTECQLKLNF